MTQTQSTKLQPIWPNNQQIEVIGISGEYASGKTLFGLTIDPANTLVYDEEKSSASYQQLGYHRIDLMKEVGAKHKNGIQPVQVYEYWRDHMQSLPDHKYSVIMLDTVGMIESGLVDWVEQHPEAFGHTKNQYSKSSALMWGDVKEAWKLHLNTLANKCQTLVFTVHMGVEYSGGTPTSKRKPKGKETLMEMASLYLILERKPDRQGNVPSVPAAIVRKSRLATFRISPDGEIITIPTLPPRLPKCTPAEIRRYILNPPDYGNLREEERAPEEKISEEEKLAMGIEKARLEAEAENAKLRRTELAMGANNSKLLQQLQASKQAQTSMVQPGNPPAAAPAAPAATAAPTQPKTLPPQDDQREPAGDHLAIFAVTKEQLDLIVSLRTALCMAHKIPVKSDEAKQLWSKVLEPFKVTTAKDLNYTQANELIRQLRDDTTLPF